MIYQMYWGMATCDQHINQWNHNFFPGKKLGDTVSAEYKLKEIAKFIKEGKDDTFIFVLVKGTGQWTKFDGWVEDNELEDYIVAKSSGITNPIHLDQPNNLRVVVMQTKEHFARIENKELVQ